MPAEAVGNIHFGKLELHPYLFLQGIMSDNIYSTSTDPKSDRIVQTTPGARLQFPFGVHLFEADYHAMFRRYDTYDGEDTDDHAANGQMDLYFGSRLSLKLSGQFEKGHEPRGASATGFIEVFRRNEAFISGAYQLAGRSKLQIDYRRTGYNFMLSDFRDREEDVASASIFYRFMPKTSVFIEYDHKTVDIIPETATLDNTMDYFLAGLTWEATARSKGTIKAGRVAKDFESAEVEDADKVVVFVDLDHKFTEYTSLLISAKRDLNETNVLGSSYYATTGITGEFKHRFNARFAGLLRSSYGKDDFSPTTPARIDRMHTEGAGLRYSIREWFEIGGDYRYRSRVSNVDAYNYRDHQSILSITLIL